MSHSSPSPASMPTRKRKCGQSNSMPSQPQSRDQTNSGSGGDIDLADLSLGRMPRSPEDEPPLPKYRRVETNLSMNCSFAPEVCSEEQGSSESITNGQTIPGVPLAQEPEPTISSLNKSNPQLSNTVIVIDDSSDEDVADSGPLNDLVAASHFKIFAEKQVKNLAPNGYFFQRLGFTTSEFLKDTFIQALKAKFERRREKFASMHSKLMQTIEELHIARKAHDREILQKISQFQFAQCPIYLIDSVEELMPLTDKHLQQYDKVIQGPADEILAFKFNQRIRRRDISTLVRSNWLNDNIINFYMNLLTERSEQCEGQLPGVYAMNSFFLQRLTLSGYASVSSWTRKVNLFSKDIIPVPVHCNGEHWCMAIIHMGKKTICYYDSKGQHNQPVLDALKLYLQQESLDKRQLPFDASGFKIETVSGSPRQTNDYDCGVFSCMIAEYITRDATINFSQKNMAYFRKRMVLEIIDGKVWS